TDPVHRLPIPSLAGLLQKAERVRDPVRAAADPWYDGWRHNYKLVAAPRKGTLLTDRKVLGIVKHWGHVHRFPRPWWDYVGVAGLVVAVLLVIALLLRPGPPRPTGSDDDQFLYKVSAVVNNSPLPRSRIRVEERGEAEATTFSEEQNLWLRPGPQDVKVTF